jgi:hypothetical protein
MHLFFFKFSQGHSPRTPSERDTSPPVPSPLTSPTLKSLASPLQIIPLSETYLHMLLIILPNLKDNSKFKCTSMKPAAYLAFAKGGGGRTSIGPITLLNCDCKNSERNVISSRQKIHGQAKGGGRTIAPPLNTTLYRPRTCVASAISLPSMK